MSKKLDLFKWWTDNFKTVNLYHGTSLLYIPHIKQHGLGKTWPYKDKLQQAIQFYLKWEQYKADPYFGYFI